MKQLLLLIALSAIFSAQAQPNTRTVPAFFLISDTATRMRGTTMISGYLKQELHNTAEGIIDPGFNKCIDSQGKEVPCYVDYWVTVEQLGPDKKPLSSWCIVWQSIEDKPKKKGGKK